MCGKDFRHFVNSISVIGSPPHVRERPVVVITSSKFIRITPACAGKTGAIERKGTNIQDHPRMCGKDPHDPIPECRHSGSPPHVRERPAAQSHSAENQRITPACAGKTCAVWVVETTKQDHPRMCGKDRWQCRMQCPKGGSPPHVRERPGNRTTGIVSWGITPACAGKTLESIPSSLGR